MIKTFVQYLKILTFVYPSVILFSHAGTKELQMIQIIDHFSQDLAQKDLFSGVVLVAYEGQILFLKSFGHANKDFQVPNKVDTKFNLGSMNKMFTAVAIAQLVEKGLIAFEDPVIKFLPNLIDESAAEKIKIKNLLSHTSGLGNYFNQRFWDSSRTKFRNVQDMLTLIKGEENVFEPGSNWQYSNTGFLILGAIIEKVTGKSYFEYVQENIFIPSGMKNTDSYDLDLVNINLAVGYNRIETNLGSNSRVEFKNNIFDHVIKGGPAGGGYSTAEDLFLFRNALVSYKLLSKEMTKVLITGKSELNSPEYGYGFEIRHKGKIVGHGGGFLGITTSMDIFLDSGFTSIILSNYSGIGRVLEGKIREVIESNSSN